MKIVHEHDNTKFSFNTTFDSNVLMFRTRNTEHSKPHFDSQLKRVMLPVMLTMIIIMTNYDEIEIILLLSQYTNLTCFSGIESGEYRSREVILHEIIEICLK